MRTIATEPAAIVEVEDTVSASPEADRERVFERFYRVLGSAESGSGLGLPIVAKSPSSTAPRSASSPQSGGQGTIAQVVFPASPAAPSPAPAAG